VFFATYPPFVMGLSLIQFEKDWDPDSLFLVAFFIVGLAIVIRVTQYLHQTSAPISLLARLATGRFLVPGYDAFHLPIWFSIATMLSIILAEEWGRNLHWHVIFSLWAALLILMFNGPSLKKWRLTGKYRYSPIPISRFKRTENVIRRI
jgi:hypothetical protein